MLTKKDRQNLMDDFQAIFITKDELKMELLELKAELLEHFATKDELKALENKMITGFGAIMGEFKAMREEMAAFSYRSREHSDQIENHETRLSLLEKSTPNALPSLNRPR